MPLCRSAICIVETKEPRNCGTEKEREKEREDKKILICIGLYSQKDDAFHYVEATRENGRLFIYTPRLCARDIKNDSPEKKIPLRYHFRRTRLFTMENESNVGMI